MVIKKGYKQTELGIIPEDWKIMVVHDACKDIFLGLTNKVDYVQSNGIPLIRANNISNGKLSFDNARLISKKQHKSLTKYHKPTHGDVLVTKSGSLGVCAIVDSKDEFSIYESIIALKPDPELIAPEFLLCILRENSVQNKLKTDVVGSGVEHINLNDFRKLVISFPSTYEQQKIVKTLFDIFEYIQFLENLIQKKKNIKQGAMQELLTGKRRLEGFSGEWKDFTLKTIVKIPITDGPHETPLFLYNGIPFLSVNNIVNSKVDLSELRYISKKDHERFSKKCKPMKGDILLGKAASVGNVAIVDFSFEFNIWSPLALLRINDKNITKFIYYYLQSQHIKKQINFLTNSSSQGNLGMGDIEKFEFLLPSKKEQLSIAIILSDMDEEINQLEKQLEKYTNLKQAMMQKLLTGEIRLV